MKIVFQGAGALGSYFGGRMLEAGYDVSYFVRERRAKQLQEEGLKISSPVGDYENKDVEFYTNVEDVKEADLLILAVKGYHLDDAIEQTAAIVRHTGAFVLPVLNGVEHIARLKDACGEEKVLGGYASIITTLNEKGHVLHTSGGSRIEFGPLHPEQESICREIEKIDGTIKSSLVRTDNILERMWYKYIFITAFSGITSATQLPAGYIANTEATFQTIRRIFEEMCLLAEKEGVELNEAEVNRRLMSFRYLADDATSSMHQDLRKGLPLEVEHLQGGALRIAEKHGLSIPVIETIYGILKPYEKGRPN